MIPIEEQTILITGATDGLGKHVAHDLAVQGATVLLHGRNREKGKTTLQEIQEATGNNKLTYYNADFASLEEARQLAEKVQTDYDRLNVLISNAGIGFGEPGNGREVSRDEYELRFQVNYLAGFLLTIRLLPMLRKSTSARIVNVASAGQQSIDFNDIMLEDSYSGQRAYGQSKLAQIMFTIELAERLNGSEVTANALHPATYMDTKMVRESGITPANTVEKGAEAVEHLAISSDLNNVTGEYFNGKHQEKANAQAYNEESRRRLWELSEELTGAEYRK